MVLVLESRQLLKKLAWERGLPKSAASHVRRNSSDQARGNRKVANTKNTTNVGTLAARSIVQWLHAFTGHMLTAISAFFNLDYKFVLR